MVPRTDAASGRGLTGGSIFRKTCPLAGGSRALLSRVAPNRTARPTSHPEAPRGPSHRSRTLPRSLGLSPPPASGPPAPSDLVLSWMTVAEAAPRLALSSKALRKALERRAHPDANGSLEASWDGITGRKLGRHWRVSLGACWRLSPSSAPLPNASTPAGDPSSLTGCESASREACCPPSGSPPPGAEDDHA